MLVLVGSTIYTVGNINFFLGFVITTSVMGYWSGCNETWH